MKIIFSPRQSGKTSYAVNWVKGLCDKNYNQKDVKNRCIVVASNDIKRNIIERYGLREDQVFIYEEAIKSSKKTFFIDDAEYILLQLFRGAGNEVEIISMSNDDFDTETFITIKLNNKK